MPPSIPSEPSSAPSPFFTGTSPNGAGGAANCDNWLDGTSDESAVGGTSDAISPDFFYGAFSGCDSPRRLLCFEVGAGDPLLFPSEAGTPVFVTSETGPGKLELWASSGGVAGIAGADAVCELRATLAGLPFPVSFVAWLSDDSADAGSRLTFSGPWERVDGVAIASSFGDLVDGSRFTSLGLTEWGAKLSSEPWTGTETSGIQSGEDCLDRTSDGSNADGTSGRSYKTGTAWTQSTPEACDDTRPIHCFSNQILLGSDAFETGDLERWSAVVAGP